MIHTSAINPKVKTWGPTLTDLAIVPILPYLFDHPVEHVTDHAFDWMRTNPKEGTLTILKITSPVFST